MNPSTVKPSVPAVLAACLMIVAAKGIADPAMFSETSSSATERPRVGRAYGPNYLKFDLGLYGSEDGDLAFVVYGKHTRTWMNSLGAEWRNEVQLGYFNNLSTSFYQPLDTSQSFLVEPRMFWMRSLEDVFYDNERLARYRFSDWGGKFDVGVNLGDVAQIRAGYLHARRSANVETGSPILPETKRDDAGLTLTGTYDARDTPFNPTRGPMAACPFKSTENASLQNRTVADRASDRATNKQATDEILRGSAHELRVRLDEIKGKTPG